LIERHFAQATRTTEPCGAPLLNRATAGKYQPGSTFKMVTASAALDTGRFTPSSPFYDPGYCVEYRKQVRNAGNPEAPETFGSVDLSTGFEHSINSVFCNVGKTLGAATVLRYAERYGFYSLPPLETPENERVASGLYNHGVLFSPKHPDTQVDPGRHAGSDHRHPRCRQDRDGGDGPREHQHHVVRRFCSRRRAQDRDRRRRREPGRRLRGDDRGADRQADDGGAAAVGANPYPEEA